MKLIKNKCVYVIHNPRLQMTKIGISDNPNQRLYTLKFSSGCELDMIYHTEPIDRAEEFEKKAHARFQDRRGIGEWFNITPAEAEAAVKEITKESKTDEIVLSYKNGESIQSIATKFKVSRQAILARLRTYGVYDTYKTSRDIKPYQQLRIPTRKEAEIEHNEDLNIKYIDELKRRPGTMKRVEPNISFDGTIYEMSIYISGVGFTQAYADDIDTAREYVARMKEK